VENEVIFP
jgi:hypothetical protein